MNHLTKRRWAVELTNEQLAGVVAILGIALTGLLAWLRSSSSNDSAERKQWYGDIVAEIDSLRDDIGTLKAQILDRDAEIQRLQRAHAELAMDFLAARREHEEERFEWISERQKWNRDRTEWTVQRDSMKAQIEELKTELHISQVRIEELITRTSEVEETL